MFPAQTSLIPVTIALTRFLEQRGFVAFSQNYPYWYLGSTPFKYLIGPAVPSLMVLLHKLFYKATFFDIAIYIIIFSFFVAAAFWGYLVGKISENEKLAFVVAILALILPWHYLVSFTLDETSFTVARNMIPVALLIFWSYLNDPNRKNIILAILASSILLLINTSVLPVLLVGIASLIMARKKVIKFTKIALWPIGISFLIATFWYTPGYWVTILFNPSIGGVSSIRVFLRLFDLFRATLPLALAILSVYLSGRFKTRLSRFTLTWFATFLFLTIFRFIGDPDFWMDWTAWGYELEIGIVLLISILFSKQFSTRVRPGKHSIAWFKLPGSSVYAASTLLLVGFVYLMTYYGWNKLGKPSFLAKNVPEGVKSLAELSKIAGNQRVFLSGSTVFWADSMYDLYQVRGGRDQVAVDPDWDKASWEFREGSDYKLTQQWLMKLNIQYVLVHTVVSREFYHDFKHIEKWDKVSNVVGEYKGDIIYKVQ